MKLGRNCKPIVRAIAGLGLALLVCERVEARGVTAVDAPAEWLSYAQAATTSIEALLRTESQTALRLKAALAKADGGVPVVLKVWVDRKSVIERVECAGLSTDQARTDLQAQTIGQRLPGKMPKGMMLPLRIALQLEAPAPGV